MEDKDKTQSRIILQIPNEAIFDLLHGVAGHQQRRTWVEDISGVAFAIFCLCVSAAVIRWLLVQ